MFPSARAVEPIFVSLTAFSSSRFCCLVKVGSKRRRTKAEILEAKERDANRSEEEAMRLTRIRELETSMALKEAQMAQYKDAHDFVKLMIDEGEIPLDDQGNVLPPSSKMKC